MLEFGFGRKESKFDKRKKVVQWLALCTSWLRPYNSYHMWTQGYNDVKLMVLRLFPNRQTHFLTFAGRI
jgi:hypothetical protein